MNTRTWSHPVISTEARMGRVENSHAQWLSYGKDEISPLRAFAIWLRRSGRHDRLRFR